MSLTVTEVPLQRLPELVEDLPSAADALQQASLWLSRAMTFVSKPQEGGEPNHYGGFIEGDRSGVETTLKIVRRNIGEN